ncbi:MAG: outer membrane beta-barrel protein [Kiritimatiellae bacterium]|jgi:hypothetical protein|nr:outer membrane beta-barrel protein [Kiritimatiellia bacterium]
MKKVLKTVVAFVCTTMFVTSSFASFGMEDKLNVAVDTGVNYTDNRDSSNYDKESTTDYRVGLILDGKLDMEMSQLSYFALPYMRYRSNPAVSQNYTQLMGSLGFEFKHRFTEVFNMSLDERFTYTDDQSVYRAGTGEQVRGDQSYYMNIAGLNFDYFKTQQTKFNVAFGNTIQEYRDNDVGNRSDRIEYSARANVVHQFSTTAAWELIVGYKEYDLASEGLAQKRDFGSTLAAVGLYNNFTEQLTAGVRAGVQYQIYKDGDIDSNAAPYASLWAKGYTIPTVRINGELSHGIADAADYPFTSVEYSRINLALNWELTKKFSFVGLGSFEYQDYSSSSSEDTVPIDLFPKNKREGSKEIGVAKVALVYTLKESCKLELSQRYECSDSDVVESFTKNDTALVLAYEF